MSPIEDYFFTNNIEVYNKEDTGILTKYSTSSGHYVLNNAGELFRMVNSKPVRIKLEE